MKKPLIAVIDDSSIIKEIVTHVLAEELGAQVINFESAESAIREMKVYDPDVILLDYNLDSKSSNNMNGAQFLRKLELIRKSPSVIMMSGQKDKRVTADMLKAGVVSYLPKDDEDFLDNLVNEVRLVLDVLHLNKRQKKQQNDLRKRAIRILSYILVPITIALICLYCQA
jgi:DNA-binding NarL/FixJ family response regulator